jgi:hypothetical protein
VGLEGRPNAEASAPSEVGEARRLDDADLIASMRAMSMGERLESGFELCELASELAGAARR